MFQEFIVVFESPVGAHAVLVMSTNSRDAIFIGVEKCSKERPDIINSNYTAYTDPQVY